jgi:hypothetical protein
MKHDQLRAIGHNLADSLASGLCCVIGYYATDIYGEAARSKSRAMTVDFLAGRVVDGKASRSLARAVALFRKALPDFCAKNGASLDDFHEISARFHARGVSRGFAVTVGDSAGRRSVTEYLGNPGARPRILDDRGRIRRKPSLAAPRAYRAEKPEAVHLARALWVRLVHRPQTHSSRRMPGPRS